MGNTHSLLTLGVLFFHKLFGAKKRYLTVFGKFLCIINIEGKAFSIDVKVVTNLGYAVLLGSDFLYKHQSSRKFFSHTFSLKVEPTKRTQSE